MKAEEKSSRVGPINSCAAMSHLSLQNEVLDARERWRFCCLKVENHEQWEMFVYDS